jgi:hypothetical protein
MNPTRTHLGAVFGGQAGWLFIGTGTGQYVTDTGKVKHGHWEERSFRWPAQTDEIVAFIAEQVAAGGDVYFTPTLSENPVREKPKNAKHGRRPHPVHTLGCDLDGDHDVTRLDQLRASGGCWMTASGSNGRAHLWVPLVEPAEPAVAEDLLRRLAAWLDADPSVAWHGAYLRPAGTKNWKPFVLSGSELPAGKVTFLNEPCEPVWTVEALDDLLPTVEQTSAPADIPDPELIDRDLPNWLTEILAEPVTLGMDRSVRTMAAVGACTRAGLSDGQIITAMRQHAPTVAKYDGRADGQVARVLGKIRAQEPGTIAEPVAKKRPTIDGDLLLDAVHAELVRYVVFPSPEAADAVTLHIGATHAQTAWEHATRLVVKSPVRRCGKTRLLEVAMELCHQVLASTNISTAALVRSIGLVNPPTIVLDEADGVFAKRKGERSEGAEEIRCILNAGHARGWPYIRWDAQSRKREECPTFAMAIIAGIGDLPDTIEDRAVIVTMRRRAPGEEVDRFRRRRAVPPLRELRAQLHDWVTGQAEALTCAEPALPVEDRAADVWEPLVALADAAGGHWPNRARQACRKLTGTGLGDEADATKLLTDIHSAFGDTDRLSTAALLEKLNVDETSPWGGWHRGDGLRPRDLARMLKPYNVEPKQVRIGDEKVRGYLVEDFGDAWSRYTDISGTPSGTSGTSGTALARDVPDVPLVPDDPPETEPVDTDQAPLDLLEDAFGPIDDVDPDDYARRMNPGELGPLEDPF